MKTDDICGRFANQRVGLSLRLLPDDDGTKDIVLIEGRREALHMLAELLLAVADEPTADGFSIQPRGAGSVHFAESSELGFYIHRLDT